eukprot:TRINITY_DN3983_c0_g1_i1.p1 TRINITY_DN3983_c0_g1~~TRINITY_DN3983_c0_g1_i1.p1  ORF type:complete len:258 (+),score=79.20 TRINITY_DN3983_c0_g1_i1:208-981(+)
MKIIPVPVLSDNYAYLLVDEASGSAAAVDPVEPEKVLAAAQAAAVRITKVLTTHKHWDHAGGNEGMKRLLPGIEVLGGALDHVAGGTTAVQDGMRFAFGGNMEVLAMHTPCHTAGHICYYVTSTDGSADPAVFTGDTLFVGGCGRFFEGSAEEMHSALELKLGRLPPNTQVFCGHEYTVKNLEFACSVDGANAALQQKLREARELRQKGLPTIPSSIGGELQFNPFMRCRDPALQAATGKSDPIEVMAELRRLKNEF